MNFNLLHLNHSRVTMAETESMSFHELQRSNSTVAEPTTSSNNAQGGRQRELDKKRLFALVGSALSQLPIWGTQPHLSIVYR
jgi:hypothetical protein